MPAFSIITPFYNTQDYFERCLESIVNQNFDDYEIILINDGSTDKSLEIAQRYADKDERIKLVSQENSGQAVARNRGLDLANGDFLVFIDSDDFVDLDMLSNLARIIRKNPSVDVVLINVYTYQEILNSKKQVKRIKSELILGLSQIFDQNKLFDTDFMADLMDKLLTDIVITTIAQYVIKRDLINKGQIRFQNIWYEDVPFCTDIFLSARKIYVSSLNPYHYVQSKNSTMRQKLCEQGLAKSANDYFTIAKILSERAKIESNKSKKSIYLKSARLMIELSTKKLAKIGYTEGINFKPQDLLTMGIKYGKVDRLFMRNPRAINPIYPLLKFAVKMKYKACKLVRMMNYLKRKRQRKRLHALKRKIA